jgi:hypothetical protein
LRVDVDYVGEFGEILAGVFVKYLWGGERFRVFFRCAWGRFARAVTAGAAEIATGAYEDGVE